MSGFILSALLLAAVPRPVLRVCADPNNLPFSNARHEGFENKIAELLANALGAELQYTWWAQRRGFFRNTLKAGLCDLVVGVPARLEMVAPTRPYYQSSYVFMTRRRDGLRITSFDDPRLRRLRIGVPLVGDDGANPPPVEALARRSIIDNVTGYSVYGDYATDNPPLAVLQALFDGEIDVAVVWGPLAGYFAKQHPRVFAIAPVEPHREGSLPFVFEIAMGVRRGNEALLQQVDGLLVAKRPAIDRILRNYGVPTIPRGP
jgi:mxaJ protein